MQQVKSPTALRRRLNARVVAAYTAIYVVWGSTFLALRYAVESIPPLLLIGLRSGIAGALLFVWVALRGEARLAWRHWRIAAIGGACFFVLCHGSLAWAEQHVSSGLAAVILALIPVWVVVLDWLRPGGTRPSRPTLVGMLLGFAGLVVLIGPDILTSGASVNVLASLVLVGSALAWATGSIASRYTALDVSPTALSAMQLLWGGGILLLGGTLSGEWNTLLSNTITSRAVLSLVYLVVVGSLLTFSAYIWLLRVSSPTRVATYAYVNPVIAVALGWAVGGEMLTAQSLLAGACIVLAVAIIITAQGQQPATP